MTRRRHRGAAERPGRLTRPQGRAATLRVAEGWIKIGPYGGGADVPHCSAHQVVDADCGTAAAQSKATIQKADDKWPKPSARATPRRWRDVHRGRLHAASRRGMMQAQRDCSLLAAADAAD